MQHLLNEPPFIVETERLSIKPLSYRQMQMYTAADLSLEESLGLELHPRTISAELKDALENAILPALAGSGDQHLYCTLWTIVLKEQRVMVGDLCFKGAPNEAGEVEIGYGTYPDFQGRGIMTEAVGAICRWALRQPGVTTVLAETDKENPASQIILLRNGFTSFRDDGNMTWWHLRQS